MNASMENWVDVRVKQYAIPEYKDNHENKTDQHGQDGVKAGIIGNPTQRT